MVMTTEHFLGSDCTGSDGGLNRTLTISNTSLTNNNNFLVVVNNSVLHLNRDYTVSHQTSSTIITFLNYLWDEQNIMVQYSTSIDSTSTGSSGILPLDTQLINNEISYFGDTITIRKVTNLIYDDYGNAQTVLGESKISYTTGDDALSSLYADNWISQTFTTDTAIDLSSIKLKIKRTGTSGTLTIGIREVDVNNKPTGSDLSSGSLDYTNLLDDAETSWISVHLTSYTLSASTTYAIVIRTDGADNSNKYEARIVTTGAYSGGNNLTSTDAGSTWTAGTSDILFDVYGDTSSVAIVDILTQEDEFVKSGAFKSGDKRFFLQNSESLTRGDKIYHSSNWYSVNEIVEDTFGDSQYGYEVLCKKI